MQLYLASQSPRRRLLLQQWGGDGALRAGPAGENAATAGIAHETIQSGIDDALLSPGTGTTPVQWAASLAFLKAVAGAEALARRGGSGIVIGADTVVVKDGQMIGQPADAADAERIIRLLQDGEHEVVTGVALVWSARTGLGWEASEAAGGAVSDSTGGGGPWARLIFGDRARVRVGPIGDARIAEYIASQGWRGKAGAYNLSERIEAGWPIDYDGDAGTIMGLPVGKLVANLARLGHTLS